MAKQLKRFLSFCLVCIMSLNVLIIRPMAAQYADDYSVKTVEISNSIYDLYVTNNRTGQVDALRVTKNGDGTCSSQGWFDIGNSNTYQITESDFRVIADKNQILYQDKNGTNKVLGAFSSGKCNEMLSSPSVLRDTYPTGWNADEPTYSSLATDVGNVMTVAAVLLSVGGLDAGTGTVIAIANYIVSNKIPTVYYKKTRYSRALSPCEQEYYYEVKWYKDAARTNLIGTSKGGTEVVNLC